MAKHTRSDESFINEARSDAQLDTGSEHLLDIPGAKRIYDNLSKSKNTARSHLNTLRHRTKACSEDILMRYPRLSTCCGSWSRVRKCALLSYVAIHLLVAFTQNFDNTSWILYTLIFFGTARALWFFAPMCWNAIVRAVPDRHRRRFVGVLQLIGALCFMGVVVVKAIQDNALISLVGIGAGIFLCYSFSYDRSAVVWRPVVFGFVLQYIFAYFILQTSIGLDIFAALGDGAQTLMGFSQVGGDFIFSKELAPLAYIVVRVLPSIVFFSTVSTVLYHLGIIQIAVAVFGTVMEKTMGTSALESLVAAANIFLGQSEAPLLIAPYLARATRAELHAIMTAGFSTIAGGVMGAYLAMGVPAAHLIGASVISAPAALAISKLVCPETERPAQFHGPETAPPGATVLAAHDCEEAADGLQSVGAETPEEAQPAHPAAANGSWDPAAERLEDGLLPGGGDTAFDDPKATVGRHAGEREMVRPARGGNNKSGVEAHTACDDGSAAAAAAAMGASNNIFAAATAGASTGLQMAANVGAMLVAFVSLEALVESAFSWWWGLVGLPTWSLTGALGVVFWPFAFLIGVPVQDCHNVGRLIGLKTVLNEFVAYVELVRMKGDGELQDKSIILSTYILCGFSNLTSIGVQLAGLGVLAPSRSKELSEVVLSALGCGFMACYSTACIAGLLVA